MPELLSKRYCSLGATFLRSSVQNVLDTTREYPLMTSAKDTIAQDFDQGYRRAFLCTMNSGELHF